MLEIPCGSRATRARPTRFAFGAAFIAALLMLLCCGGGLDDHELACEQAVSRLDECCPGFDNRGIKCIYEVHGSCDPVTDHPAIGEAQSACILKASCADLVAHGVCKRAEDAREYSTGEGNEGSEQAVCP